MIKFKLVGDEKPVYVLGLEKINLDRIVDNNPVYFDMQDLGLSGQMFIMYEATSIAFTKELTAMTYVLVLHEAELEKLRAGGYVSTNLAGFGLEGTLIMFSRETKSAMLDYLGLDGLGRLKSEIS